jgi:uncharacterized protein (DUF2062 family)
MKSQKNPPSLCTYTKNFFWPSIGWRRSFRYIALRIGRLPGSAGQIARGFACGAAISFTPFIGLHFIIAAIVARFMKGSLVASAIGTFVGNPWTFPFIWWLIYKTGLWILPDTLQKNLPSTLSFSYMWHNLFDIWLPMLIGSLPYLPIVWIMFFLPVRYLTKKYQNHRRAKINPINL